MLEAMEKRRYLVSHRQRAGRSIQRLYGATPLGRDALAVAKARLRGLFRLVVEEDAPNLTAANQKEFG